MCSPLGTVVQPARNRCVKWNAPRWERDVRVMHVTVGGMKNRGVLQTCASLVVGTEVPIQNWSTLGLVSPKCYLGCMFEKHWHEWGHSCVEHFSLEKRRLKGDHINRYKCLRSHGVSSSEIFKSLLDMVLGTLLWVALLEQGLDQRSPKMASKFNCSTVLWKKVWYKLKY